MTIDTPQTRDARRPATTAAQAANDPAVLAFDRLQDAARSLRRLFDRVLEREFGISFEMLEVLLLLDRAASPLPIRRIAQARVLTSAGASRLVDRMQAAGLVRRDVSPQDQRTHVVALTAHGAATTVQAVRQHVREIQRHMFDTLPHDQREALLAALAQLSRATPTMPP